jgi:hypothetical protein
MSTQENANNMSSEGSDQSKFEIRAGDIEGTYAAIGQGATVIINQALSAAEAAKRDKKVEEEYLAESIVSYIERLRKLVDRTKKDADRTNPYVGLRPYDISDAAFFYGRSSVTFRLLDQLNSDRLTILYSGSGTGKTSLLRAGIIPNLLANGRVPLYVRPLGTPVHSAVKTSLIPNLNRFRYLVESPLRDFLGGVTNLLGSSANQSLVIILDQFEEVFLVQDTETRRESFDEISRCLLDLLLPVRWIFSIREEHLSELASLQTQIPDLFANTFQLMPLSRDQAREAIVEPAFRFGVSFESGLVEKMLDDMGPTMIAPYELQVICYKLFEARNQESQINNDLYNQLGRSRSILRDYPDKLVSGAIAEVAIRALSDKPSEIDLLEFKDYADALVDFITSDKTDKPLTIAIDAPWGMGKTTLMKMIKKQLDELPEEDKWKWWSPKILFDKSGHNKAKFHTVWFNAWKYDQEESLWAALALEILGQMHEKTNLTNRIEFLVRLTLKRFNWGQFLRSIVVSLGYLFVISLIGALIMTIALITFGNQNVLDLLLQYIKAIGILSFATALYAAGKEVYELLSGTFDLNIEKYVRKPKYRERIGFLSEFEDDFKRVVDVTTQNGKQPLVVFIDDLDRCVPPKPAEVIEAINILLDAEHCVFIIGMDAPTVAGSVEAKYKDLDKFFLDPDDPGGFTLGQRFLEKIVQINFSIPKVDKGVMASFIDGNLGTDSRAGPEKPARESVFEVEYLIKEKQKEGKSLGEAEQDVQSSMPNLSESVVREARRKVFAETFDDSPEVREAILEAAPYLDLNPRKIKRFINLLRLKALIANRRGLLEKGEIRLIQLARLVTIELRWPDLLEGYRTSGDFIYRLQEAHELQKLIQQQLNSQSAGTKEENEEEIKISREQLEHHRANLESLLTKARISRLINASDLFELFDLINISHEDLGPYLQLAEITKRRVGVTE